VKAASQISSTVVVLHRCAGPSLVRLVSTRRSASEANREGNPQSPAAARGLGRAEVTPATVSETLAIVRERRLLCLSLKLSPFISRM